MKINKSFFGTTKQGEEVDLFTLENNIGTIVKIINYGATITSILTHDKQGVLGDIALGFDNIEGLSNIENFKVIEKFGNEKKNKNVKKVSKKCNKKNIMYNADGTISYV